MTNPAHHYHGHSHEHGPPRGKMAGMIAYFICTLFFFGALGTALAFFDRLIFDAMGWGFGLIAAIPPAFCFGVILLSLAPILQQASDYFVYGFIQGLRGKKISR